MSAALVYNGRDLSALCEAELRIPAGCCCDWQAQAAAGHEGLVLEGGILEPLPLVVRLFAADEAGAGEAARAAVRRELRRALAAPGGAVLSVAGEPGLEWHDVVVESCTSWSHLREGASCEVGFLALDPVAWGAAHESAEDSIVVGGSWPSLPELELVADGSETITVAEEGLWQVELVGPFSADEAVVLDFARERCVVAGSAASGRIALGSLFSALAPGEHLLSFSGCSAHTVRWQDRWL